MNLFRYIHDKLLIVVLNLSGVLLLSFYLLTVGNTLLTIALIDLVWGSVFLLYFGIEYYKRRQYFEGITRQMTRLDKPYLIHEMMEKTWRYEDEVYKDILRKSTISAMEVIVLLEEEQGEYKEFIEAWIHEVKLPITSLYLMSAELKGDSARKLQAYLIDLENQVDQALFYARSDYVHQDYLIREAPVQEIISELVKKNKFLLIQNQMQITIDCEGMVHTDKKWLAFIINQLLFNAVKYKKEGSGQVSFKTISTKESTRLIIRDEGLGIVSHELPRVFDKGFTGTNGRDAGKATGFGLYLCKKLCTKLGLTIEANSTEDEYTEMILTFPKNSYLSDL